MLFIEEFIHVYLYYLSLSNWSNLHKREKKLLNLETVYPWIRAIKYTRFKVKSRAVHNYFFFIFRGCLHLGLAINYRNIGNKLARQFQRFLENQFSTK